MLIFFSELKILHAKQLIYTNLRSNDEGESDDSDSSVYSGLDEEDSSEDDESGEEEEGEDEESDGEDEESGGEDEENEAEESNAEEVGYS